MVLGLEGAVLMGVGRYEEALALVQEPWGRAVRQQPAGRWLVRAHVKMGNRAKANAIARVIRDRDPNIYVTGAILRKRSLDSSK